MKKTVAQLSPLAPLPPAGSPGMMADPAVMGGAGGGVPGAVQYGKSGAEKKLDGLATPDDVFKDYDVAQAFEDEKNTDAIVDDIWQMYGGNLEGTDAEDGKIGTWPDKQPENLSQDKIDAAYDATEDCRWERLKKGYTIMDIFDEGQAEIKQKISGYTTSLGLTRSKQPAQASNLSWYKIAHGTNRTN